MLMAGFDTGNPFGLDLATLTNHTPETNMRSHYRTMRAHGITRIRDGLPPDHDIAARLRIAYDEGMHVIWDLDHWWRHTDPADYAWRVVEAFNRVCPSEPFHYCFNELSVEALAGRPFQASLADAKKISDIIRRGIYTTYLTSAEPAHSEADLRAHDWWPEATIIGLNLYPHHLKWGIADALITAYRQFARPIMITETSLNPNRNERWQGIADKAAWLRHCRDEIELARVAGVVVTGCCWYPILDNLCWHDPRNPWWTHGLIHQDGSVDEALSAEMRR